MAHFAEIDENNKVIRVLVVDNEHENRGEEYLAKDCKLGGKWVQTSYNAKIRGKFASVGDTYNPKADVFHNSQPEDYPSFVLNEKFEWVPPVTKPTSTKEGFYWAWEENTTSWIEKELPVIE